MKLISFLLASILTLSAFAAPPMGVSGQQDTSNQYPSVIQTHNKLATNLGSGKTLIESGNTNILTNPSFEHSSWNTAWTVSTVLGVDVVASAETSTVIDGKKAAKVTVTASSFEATNDSTLYAAQYANSVQGLAYARVKTSLSGVKLCARKAGTTSTTLCATHSGSGNWELLKVPFVLSTTSNGISIANYSAQTGTVYIDNAFVGAVDLKVDTNNISDWVSYTPTGSWTNATYTGKWRRIGDSMEVNFEATLTGAASGVDFNVSIPTGYTIDTSKFAEAIFLQSIFGSAFLSDASANTHHFAQVGYLSTSTVFLTYQNQTTGQVNSLTASLPFVWASGDKIKGTFQVPIVGWGSSGSIYSSTNADTDWQACTFSTLAWQGLGTVTNNLECKRRGSDLLMRGVSTIGTVSSSEARIPLPLWNGVQLVNKSNGFYGYLTTGNGTLNRPKSFATYSTATGLSYINIGVAEYSLASGAIAPLAGNTYLSNSDFLIPQGELVIPIQGWENSNIIIGQFNGLESCTNTFQCTDTFSAYVNSSGTVSSENVDWISGNASISTQYILNLNTSNLGLTTGMNCQATADNVGRAVRTFSTGASQVQMTVFNTNTQVAVSDTGFTITCQKQGADYIGRTARAVASDQNVRTNGLLKSVMYSGAFAVGTSTPLQTYGDWIQSISSSGTGQVTFNFKTNTFASRPTCIITGYKTGAETNSYGCNLDIAATNTASSVSFRCNQNSTTAFNVSADILCHGYSP